MTERGLIEWVETYPPRSFATVSVAAGFNKVLQVEDAEVFLLPDGVDTGEVLIDGVVHTYTAVFDSDDEDVPSTITVPSLNVAVDVGDPIELYPVEPTTWAGVSIAGDDDGDIMTARVDHALLGYTALADGPRDPETRELAILEYREDTELVLVGIDGAVGSLDAGTLDGTIPDATLADTQMKADLDAAAAAIGDAASNASTALSDAAAAVSAADAASDLADAAQIAAVNAALDAQAAAGIANSKGKVLVQSATPPSYEQSALNLWIDTTGGANTPKRWDGSAWVAVTDKVAVDAASVAASKGKVFIQSSAPGASEQLVQNLWIDTTGGANTPKRWNGSVWEAVTDKVATDAATVAANAAIAAGAAATNASSALTAANGKNKVIFSAAAASGTTSGGYTFVDGDVWFQRTAGVIVGQWEFVSGAWAVRTIDNAVIANLNAGKITAGNLDAGAVTIRTAATGPRVELKAAGIIGYDGAGVAKTVIDATTGKITAVDGTFTGTVTATSGTFTGVVNATDGNFVGDVTTDTANVAGSLNIADTGVVNAGSRITISQPTNTSGVLSGGIEVWPTTTHTGTPLMRLHPDGNNFKGAIDSDTASVGTLSIKGPSSAIASGGKVTLENGVANPAAPSISYGTIQADWPAIPTGYSERGICWDSSTPTGVGQWWQLLWRSANQRAYVRTISTSGTPSTLTLLPMYNFSSPVTMKAVAGIAYLNGALYTNERVQYTGSGNVFWYLVQHFVPSLGVSNFSDTPTRSQVAAEGTTGFPAVGTDGTNIYTAVDTGGLNGTGNDIQITKYTNPGEFTIGTRSYAIVGASGTDAETKNLRGLQFGNLDRGTPLLQLTTSLGNVRHYTPATFSSDYLASPALVRATSHDYTIDPGAWQGYKSSGTNTGFYSSKSDAKLGQYSTYFPTSGEKWWAQYADTAPSKTTAVSPESVGVAVPARRFATVNLNPAPAGVTGADVFVGYGSSTPGTTKKKRTETLTDRSLVLTLGKVTGTDVMPSTNTMGGTPAELADSAGNSWKGTGVVNLPGLTVSASESVAGVAPFAAVDVVVSRIGGLKFIQGSFNRASGTSTSFVKCGAISAQFRPAADLVLEAKPIFSSAPPSPAHMFQFVIRATGDIEVRQYGTNTAALSINATWT